MKFNICKYYLTQAWLVDGWIPVWETHKFKSSLPHQHTLFLRLHYSLLSLHYSFCLPFPLIKHFVTDLQFSWWDLGKAGNVDMHVIHRGCGDGGLQLTSSPHCGFEAFVWHARFYLSVVIPEPRLWPQAKQSLRCPPGYHSCCQCCVWTGSLPRWLLKCGWRRRLENFHDVYQKTEGIQWHVMYAALLFYFLTPHSRCRLW